MTADRDAGGETVSEPFVEFATHPSRYRHWSLVCDGDRATLTMTALEAAVVGGRDASGLETVVAFVFPAGGALVDTVELLAHCRERTAAFKRPREIHIVDELPQTATGKIKRFVLRDEVGSS